MRRMNDPGTLSTLPDDELDRRVIAAVAKRFRPEPMSPARQAAFRRRIEERLPPRQRFSWEAAALVGAAAAAAALLWISSTSVPEAPPMPVAASQPSSLQSEENIGDALLAAAEEDGDTTLSEDDYLPRDYIVLASYLEVESARK